MLRKILNIALLLTSDESAGSRGAGGDEGEEPMPNAQCPIWMCGYP
ncbi:hypothetical protein COO91_05950 [Nostoc flagelliforme CCNUN1]|uniref:Uncharacterized protein n=1 Tax=Nostoc flagelliforme CCNUN1 TaxID=2038116 RepID=A0A2K8SWZ7_9NOSO|nr:hypothetical protein COO91_05950 [Nostoc flagelliforme CCNUN1]